MSVGGKTRRVHRVMYELLVGPIPDGLTIDHLCRVRSCCNPAHLEAVTNAVNILRGEGVAGRAARRDGCSQGHPYTAANLYVGPSRPRTRLCRECARERERRRPKRLRVRVSP